MRDAGRILGIGRKREMRNRHLGMRDKNQGMGNRKTRGNIGCETRNVEQPVRDAVQELWMRTGTKGMEDRKRGIRDRKRGMRDRKRGIGDMKQSMVSVL